jgi:hypothetical protein
MTTVLAEGGFMFSRRNRVVLSCAVLLVAAVTATAQNTTSYTKVLNADASPVSLFCFTGECSPIEARTAQRLEASPSATGGPGLLYIPTDSARRLTLALRSRNTTPNSDERDFISAIPVVRESEFRSSTIELPAVPIEANYRHMLRIFDANANEEGRVRVRVWGMQNGRIVTNALIDTEITLRTARGTASPFARPDEPAVAALGNFSDQSGVRDFPEVHIRIEALSNNMELWALATATNNTTQRFAVYTP